MKKSIFVILILTFVFILSSLYACENVNPLYKNVVEVKYDLYSGECFGEQLKASQSFTVNEEKGDKIIKNYITFKLPASLIDNADIKVSLVTDKEYSAVFKLSPITNTYTAKIEVDKIEDKEFTVNLIRGNEKSQVLLKSLISENTIDYLTALDFLSKNQSTLIDLYSVDGNFNANITMRIIVRNDKPYWYIGIEKDGKVKALLIDGITGNVLAVRDIL